MSTLRKFAIRKDNAVMRLMIMLLVPVMLIATVSMTAYAQSGIDNALIFISRSASASVISTSAPCLFSTNTVNCLIDMIFLLSEISR